MFHHKMRAVLPILMIAAAFGPAAAVPATPPERGVDRLWATVNVCDTEAKPNAIGIRASMPGTRRKGVMFMRFRVQYLSRIDGKWHNIGDGADSGFIRVGTSRDAERESGWTFRFKPNADGTPMTLRGAVSYQWRRKKEGRVLRRARRFTESGHVSTAGADPDGYSATTCVITPP